MQKGISKSRKLTPQEKSLWKKVTKDMIDRHGPVNGVSLSVPLAMMPQNIINKLPANASTKTKASVKIKVRPKATIKQDPIRSNYLAKLLDRFDKTAHPAHGKVSTKPIYGNGYSVNSQYDQSYSQPQNSPLERNIRQKLQRGRAEIDARLDLHGYNKITAHQKLVEFLRSSYQQGLKTVIVVTGKGDGPISRHNLHSADFYQLPEQNSVLRASIGDWLNDGDVSPYIVGWQPAHPKHGGGGAVYVRLRNKHRYQG